MEEEHGEQGVPSLVEGVPALPLPMQAPTASAAQYAPPGLPASMMQPPQELPPLLTFSPHHQPRGAPGPNGGGNSSRASRSQAPPVCQVPGCGRDLSDCRGYHQRYRICEEHFRVPSMVLDGQVVRFCQQCGKFQPLTDFHDDRRSCTVQLALHAGRRRKRHAAARARKLGDALKQRLGGSGGSDTDEEDGQHANEDGNGSGGGGGAGSGVGADGGRGAKRGRGGSGGLTDEEVRVLRGLLRGSRGLKQEQVLAAVAQAVCDSDGGGSRSGAAAGGGGGVAGGRSTAAGNGHNYHHASDAAGSGAFPQQQQAQQQQQAYQAGPGASASVLLGAAGPTATAQQQQVIYVDAHTGLPISASPGRAVPMVLAGAPNGAAPMHPHHHHQQQQVQHAQQLLQPSSQGQALNPAVGSGDLSAQAPRPQPQQHWLLSKPGLQPHHPHDSLDSSQTSHLAATLRHAGSASASAAGSLGMPHQLGLVPPPSAVSVPTRALSSAPSAPSQATVQLSSNPASTTTGGVLLQPNGSQPQALQVHQVLVDDGRGGARVQHVLVQPDGTLVPLTAAPGQQQATLLAPPAQAQAPAAPRNMIAVPPPGPPQQLAAVAQSGQVQILHAHNGVPAGSPGGVRVMLQPMSTGPQQQQQVLAMPHGVPGGAGAVGGAVLVSAGNGTYIVQQQQAPPLPANQAVMASPVPGTTPSPAATSAPGMAMQQLGQPQPTQSGTGSGGSGSSRPVPAVAASPPQATSQPLHMMQARQQQQQQQQQQVVGGQALPGGSLAFQLPHGVQVVQGNAGAPLNTTSVPGGGAILMQAPSLAQHQQHQQATVLLASNPPGGAAGVPMAVSGGGGGGYMAINITSSQLEQLLRGNAGALGMAGMGAAGLNPASGGGGVAGGMQ